MKKLSLIIMCVIVFILPFISAKQTHAIGFVGSNAVKSAVINSLESAGVKFSNKQAKERAFEAWNMKAYEKWKADEAAGRNADLWAHFNSVTQTMASSSPIPEPSKPNFGKILLDATWFGMAISIGAEIGYAIEDAQQHNKVMKYLESHQGEFDTSANYDAHFGFYERYAVTEDYYGKVYNAYLQGPGDSEQNGGYYAMGNSRSPEGAFVNITSIVPSTLSGVLYYHVSWVGGDNGRGSFYFKASNVQPLVEDGRIYEKVPSIDDLPSFLPNRHVEPLITPQPDISTVPQIIPQKEPIPMIVPLNDPFEDNPYVEPYAPPEPVKPPEKEPGTDPGTTPTPGQDPNKKPIPEIVPEPGAIKDPLEQPKEVKPENLSCERVQRPDFEPLGNAFTTSFPFSLPWDLKRYLDASFSGIGSEKPKFALPFFGDGVEITIPDELDKYVSFFKGFILIIFDVSIIYLFVRVMRGGSD